MTASIERNVYVLRRELPNPIHYVRSTNAISLIFHFRDIEIPSGATAQIYVRKPSGKEVYNTAVISGSDVTVDVTTQMFIEAGKNILQVQINQGEENLVTFDQPVIVHENYTEGDAEQSENESTLLQQYVDEVAQAAEDAKNEVQNEVANGKNDLDDYVEALKETIPADYTELSESVEQLERNKAPAIIEEASGTEITLDDSGPAPVKDLHLYGYSKQTQTTGAQMLDYSTLSGAQNGITPSIDDENYIVLNGTATANAFIYVLCNIPSGTSMFISVNNTVSNNNISVYIRDEESTYSSEYIALDTANKTHAFASVSVAISRFVIRVVQGTTLNDFRLRPMLNSGTSALPWEPYSGGVASPSPDWAQPIHSVADEVNLLDEGLFEQTDSTYKYIYISTSEEQVTVSADFPRMTGGGCYIFAIPGHITSSDHTITNDSGVYAGQNRTLTPSDGYVTIAYRYYKSGAENIDFSQYWAMVNVGDVALPWRPYGHNVTVESVGAQLYDASLINGKESAGITALVTDDGEIILDGTATGNVFFDVPAHQTFSGSITTSTNNDIANENVIFRFLSEEGIIENFVLNVPDKVVTYNLIKTCIQMTIRISQGTTLNQFKLKPMVNRGSTPIPWQPYVAPPSALITLTDSLRGLPVTSGGNYTDESGQQWIADYIYRRQTDGKWMLWRNIKCAEYDGSTDEVWNVSVAGDNIFTTSDFSGVPLNGLCNRFRYKNNPESAGEFEFDTNHSFRFYTELNGAPAWRTWLQSNPLEVVYQIATPTVEELPENVQAELNGLMTYNLHTDMWNSDNAHMALKYVADTKSYIDKKIAEISDAIIKRLN